MSKLKTNRLLSLAIVVSLIVIGAGICIWAIADRSDKNAGEITKDDYGNRRKTRDVTDTNRKQKSEAKNE
jgi:uncharacterized membrane protein YqjE